MQRVYFSFEGVTLTPGNKSAGFNAGLPAETVRALHALPLNPERAAQFQQRLQEVLARAGVAAGLVKHSGVAFYQDTVLPLVFVQDGMVGGSLGLTHREVEDILDPDLEPQYRPAELWYTPHNVDAPAQAIILMLVVSTWAEWATDELLLAAR